MKNNLDKYIMFILFLINNILFGNVAEYIVTINSLIDDGSYDKANNQFIQSINEYDSNSELYFIGGQIAIKLDKLDEANKYIIHAIELDNKNKEYRVAQQKLEE